MQLDAIPAYLYLEPPSTPLLSPLRAEAIPAEGGSMDEEMESLIQHSDVVELLKNSDVDVLPSPTDEMATGEMVPSAGPSTTPRDAQGSSDAYEDGISQESERDAADKLAQVWEQNAAETKAL